MLSKEIVVFVVPRNSFGVLSTLQISLKRGIEGGCSSPVSHLVELEFETHILGAVSAVIAAETTAFDLHVLAHVNAPDVVRVAGEQALRADLNAVGPDIVVVVAVVPAVSVGAHFDGFWFLKGAS